jgi:citrate synthase
MISVGLVAFCELDKGTIQLHSQNQPYFLGNLNNSGETASIIHVLTSMATAIALAYCQKNGYEYSEPDFDGSFIGNILKMMGRADAETERYLERLLTFLRTMERQARRQIFCMSYQCRPTQF